jgi:hypothetical protein
MDTIFKAEFIISVPGKAPANKDTLLTYIRSDWRDRIKDIKIISCERRVDEDRRNRRIQTRVTKKFLYDLINEAAKESGFDRFDRISCKYVKKSKLYIAEWMMLPYPKKRKRLAWIADRIDFRLHYQEGKDKITISQIFVGRHCYHEHDKRESREFNLANPNVGKDVGQYMKSYLKRMADENKSRYD